MKVRSQNSIPIEKKKSIRHRASLASKYFLCLRRSPRMKQPRFSCWDRNPKHRGGLMQGAFQELIQFDSLPKCWSQLCDRISQGCLLLAFFAQISSESGEESSSLSSGRSSDLCVGASIGTPRDTRFLRTFMSAALPAMRSARLKVVSFPQSSSGGRRQ